GSVLAKDRKAKFLEMKRALKICVVHWNVMSYSSIASFLNRHGFNTINGKPFSSSTVRRYFNYGN
ncbi:hypothetical protein KIH24_15430, partial [Rhizobiales bacterium TNE-4]|nr:hypothetical protein [Rhizobiales bacterium TNE-4]MBV1829016.1 recombinase family protein [Rhizobiales bacterium TNE-4]